MQTSTNCGDRNATDLWPWSRVTTVFLAAGSQYPFKVFVSGKQRSPLAFTLARHHCQLPPCFMVQVGASTLSAKKTAHIHLECLWSRSSLKTFHRWAKTGFRGMYLHLLLQCRLNTHMENTGLPHERENISGRRFDKIQQIQFHSPNLNQQMWSVVINRSPANHYGPWLPSALSFSAENHKNGADLAERGE